MVRCTKCGTENKEDARFCVQCGASMYPAQTRYEKHEKTESNVCYGPIRTVRYLWLFFGAFLILWGISELLRIIYNVNLNIWPFMLIAIGLYIIYRILTRSWRL